MSGGMPAGRVAQNAKSDVIVNDLPSAFIDRTGSRHSYGAGPMAVHVARNALHQETRRDLYSGNAGDPQLGYDGAHRLVQLKRTKVNGEHWQAEYAYDPLSRRIRKQVQYTDAHGQQHPAITTCYGWDGDQQSAEAMQDPEGEWHIRTTLYEPGSFVPLLRMDQSQPSQEPAVLELKRQLAEAGEPLPDALREVLAEDASDCRYASYHTDHLGTPLALTDELGKPLWEASPDDWAAVTGQQGSTDQPLRFQGQYEDEESGLYYNRHRYYDPKLGRYVNQDPIGLMGGSNYYEYSDSSPTVNYDPYGLLSFQNVTDPIFGAVYAVTGGWSPSQGAVDFSAGLGDGIINILSFGLISGESIRSSLGVDGGVKTCSSNYDVGNLSGTGVATVVSLAGAATKAAATYVSRSKALSWRSNSRTSRKTRNKKIQAAGNYRDPVGSALLSLIGGEGVSSWRSIHESATE